MLHIPELLVAQYLPAAPGPGAVGQSVPAISTGSFPAKLWRSLDSVASSQSVPRGSYGRDALAAATKGTMLSSC